MQVACFCGHVYSADTDTAVCPRCYTPSDTPTKESNTIRKLVIQASKKGAE